MSCPNMVGFFCGVALTEKSNVVKSIYGNLRCKKWDCPHCAKKNLKELRKRIFNSLMYQNIINSTYRERYNHKFLTLTYPGRDVRQITNPDDAYYEMSRNFDKLTKALKKKRGDYQYIKVWEPQRDGFPHLHVLMCGQNIASKDVLDDIENLWRFKYGMGFIKINKVRNAKHAVRYITKYITKTTGVTTMPKSKHRRKGKSRKKRYSASRDALEKRFRASWLDKKVFIGCVREDVHGGIVVEEHEINPNCPEAIRHILDFISNPDLYDEIVGISYEDQMSCSYLYGGEFNDRD